MKYATLLIFMMSKATFASDAQSITLKYADLAGHNCADEKSTVVARLQQRSDLVLLSANCSRPGFSGDELTLKFRWTGAAHVIHMPSLGLIAGGGDDVVTPFLSEPSAYYGAFPSVEECQSWRTGFEAQYESASGLEVVASFCNHSFAGGYELQLLTIGEQRSKVRHLEFHLQGVPDADLLDRLNQIITDGGGRPILTTTMSVWLSVNYFSDHEIRVGILDGTPTFAVSSFAQCETERRVLNRIMLDNYQFSFDVSECLADTDNALISLNDFYTKALPPVVFGEDADYPTWEDCHASRAAILSRALQAGQTEAVGVLCLKKDVFLDKGFVAFIVAKGEA